MKRVILDTNIYGLMALDSERLKIVERSLSAVAVYGSSVIRKELRATPKGFVDGINLRNDLIRLFDGLVRKSYEITAEMTKAADSYYVAYKELGGIRPREKIISDFLIVACAAFHGIDIVVSEDEKTMVSENAVRAYKIINSVLGRRTPEFIDYTEFRRLIFL